MTILWFKVYTRDSPGIDRLNLQHLSDFTRLHTVYVEVSFLDRSIFMVQGFAYLPANIRTVVCHQFPFETDLGEEIVMRCDSGWHYKVEQGRAWDRCFVDEHGDANTQICHTAERTS